jgi:hypothetical protein
MAQDTLTVKATPSNPGGMNDNSPAEEIPAWFRTNGIHSHSQQFLQRCNGKLLINKFDSPILNIHGDLRDMVFIETKKAVYIFGKITDAVPLPVSYLTESTVYDWQELNPASGGDGTQLMTLVGVDDGAEAVDVSFEFPFFGDFYSKIWVEVNGVILFDSSDKWAASGNFLDPDTLAYPNAGYTGDNAALIVPFAADLETSTRGKVFKRDEGNAIRIQWDDMMHYGLPASHYTFQVLIKNTGEIIMYYKNMVVFNDGSFWWGDCAIQNLHGERGTNAHHNTATNHAFFANLSAQRFYIAP